MLKSHKNITVSLACLLVLAVAVWGVAANPFKSSRSITSEVIPSGGHVSMSFENGGSSKFTRWLGRFIPRISAQSELDIVNTSLITSTGETLTHDLEITVTDDSVEVEVPDELHISPGKYTTVIDSMKNGQEEKQEASFWYGVLAINTDKAVYATGETADIALAVLDSSGMVVCNAEVTVAITSPGGVVSTLSLKDATITQNPLCAEGWFAEEPDYSLKYEVSEVGVYAIRMEVTTDEGQYSLDQQFESRSKVPFEIERIAATRINPKIEYPVILKVTSYIDYAGPVRELVPESFQVRATSEDFWNANGIELYSEGMQRVFSESGFGISDRLSENQRIVDWNVNWEKGNTYYLAYAYGAQEISPELYHVGPLQIGEYREPRLWSIATDIVDAVPDNAVSATAENHQGNGRNVVFVSELVGYHFFIDSDGVAGYQKTLNAGINWAPQVDLTAQTDCSNIAVWYDGWTPGGYDGTLIHVAFLENGNDIYYENMDIASSDTQKGEVLAVDRSTTGHTSVTDSISIARATNGILYIAAESSVASSTAVVMYSSNTGTSWNTTADEGMDNAVGDFVMLDPLNNGDMLLIRWDVSADDIQSKEYEDGGNTWDGSWTNADTNAVDDPNASSADPHKETWASLAHPDNTGYVYMSYVDNAGLASATPDVRTAIYNGSSWSAKTDVVSNVNSIMGTAIGMDLNNGFVYVAYISGTVNASNAVFARVSTDDMSSWVTTKGNLVNSLDDHKSLNMNLVSNEVFALTAYDDDDDDIFFGQVADVGSISPVSVATFQTGMEANSLYDAEPAVGTVSVQGSVYRSGEYALRSNPTSSVGYATYPVVYVNTGVAGTVDMDTISSIFAIRVATAPGTNAVIWDQNETTTKLTITLNTDLTISTNGTGSPTGTYAMSTGTWYVICILMNSDGDYAHVSLLSSDMTTQHDFLSVIISGLEDVSSVNLGIKTSTTADVYFDDYMVYAGQEVGNFPMLRADYHINRMDLDSVGYYTAWTNDYQSIDEIPPSATDYIETNAIAIETSNLESTSSAGITGTPMNVNVSNTVWESAANTGTHLYTIRLYDTGVASTALVDVPTRSTRYARIFEVNYARTANEVWTLSFLDGIGVGIATGTAPTTGYYRNGSTVVDVSWANTITVSGNVYNAGTSTALTECDTNEYTYELRLKAYGQYYSTSCSSSDGSFTFSSVTTPPSGDGLVLWIDDNAAPETDGAVVVRYDGTGDSTSNIFFDDTVTVTSDDTTGVDILDMNELDYGDDPDIPYTATDASTDTLVVNSGYEFLVKIKSGVSSGSTVFDPGGTVTTNSTGGDFHVDDNSTAYIDTATSIVGRDIEVDAGGTLNIDASTNVTGGDITTTSTGSVTYSTGTPTVDLSGGGAIGGGSGTVMFYTLTLSGSTNTTTVGTSFAIKNSLTIATGRTLSMGSYNLNMGSTDVTNSGGIAVSGEFSQTGGSTYINSSSGGTANVGGAGTITFYNLSVTPSAVSAPTIRLGMIVISGSQTVTVSNDLTVGGMMGAVTVSAETYDANLDVNGDMTIASGSTFQASSTGTFTIAGNFIKNGTFTANSGTVSFDDASQTSQLNYSSDTSFYGFASNTAGKALQFDEAYRTTITDSFSLQGSNCTTGRIFLDSITDNNQWDITYSGSTLDIDYADIEDSNANSTITADNSTADNDNNTNWTINSGACGNALPVVTSVSVNGGSDVTLVENTTVSVSWTATVTDTDGFDDLATANGVLYRSGVSGAEACTANNNNCYVDASCDYSGCSGNSCTATCTISMYFHADPTDSGSPQPTEYWRGWIEAIDDQSATGEGWSGTGSPDVGSLLAISIDATIPYDPLLPGDNTGSTNEVSNIVNTGNRAIDLNVSGDTMCTDYPTCNGYTVPVGNQEYYLSSFTYGSGTDLTASAVTVQANMTKPTTSPSNSTSRLYWGLGIPNPQQTGVYSGVNTVSATGDV